MFYTYYTKKIQYTLNFVMNLLVVYDVILSKPITTN